MSDNLSGKSKELQENFERISHGCQAFGINLYRKILVDNEGNNLCISPNSLMTALVVLLAGTRGETEKQIAEALKLDGMGQDDIHQAYKTLLDMLAESGTTAIANALFLKNGFQLSPRFSNIANTYYNVETQNLDFANDSARCVEVVNGWCNKATRGKIDSIIKGFDTLTIMVIINAVYFKSAWKSQFRPSETNATKFYLSNQKFIPIKMMYQKNKFNYSENEAADCKVLELVYKDLKASMVIFLPNQVEGLPKVEAALSPKFLEDAFSSFKEEIRMEVFLPSFKLEFSCVLNKILSDLGMTAMFNLGAADLSGISENASLRISQVIQKTFIEVNEEGTEAAAISMLQSDGASAPPSMPKFRADHPFLYFIIDRRSRNILFMGRLVSPKPLDATTRNLKHLMQ